MSRFHSKQNKNLEKSQKKSAQPQFSRDKSDYDVAKHAKLVLMFKESLINER